MRTKIPTASPELLARCGAFTLPPSVAGKIAERRRRANQTFRMPRQPIRYRVTWRPVTWLWP